MVVLDKITLDIRQFYFCGPLGKGKVDADILEIWADSAPSIGPCQFGEAGGGGLENN